MHFKPSTPAAEREKEFLVTTTPSLNGKSHAGSIIDGAGARTPKTEAERAAELNARRLPNLRSNAQMVAKDLPDPAAVGYLLLLFDQCRLYDLTHEQLVDVFGRPLLAFLDLSLQATEKLAQRSGIGNAGAGEPPIALRPEAAVGEAAGEEAEEAESCLQRRIWLTPYQLTRLRDIAGDYAAALPDSRALDALLLVYDLLEVFELSSGQCETVFGVETLRYLTGITYGERGGGKQAANAEEAIQYDLPAQDATPTAALRINGRPIPFFGTVGENGHVTYTPEARLWLRYIGKPDEGAADMKGGAA